MNEINESFKKNLNDMDLDNLDIKDDLEGIAVDVSGKINDSMTRINQLS